MALRLIKVAISYGYHTGYTFNLLTFLFIPDPCKNQGCEHICINVDNDNAMCYCKEGYTLNTDNKTCNGKFISHVQERKPWNTFWLKTKKYM